MKIGENEYTQGEYGFSWAPDPEGCGMDVWDGSGQPVGRDDVINWRARS